LEEVLSDDDDYDNRSASIPFRAHDIFLSRIHSPTFVRSQSPLTVSSRASSRNMIGSSGGTQIVDENRYLNDELNRVETVLNLTRAEKDELSIRYNALSDRVSVSDLFVRGRTIEIFFSKTLRGKEKQTSPLDVRRLMIDKYQRRKSSLCLISK
jgi:hypothetical protein